MKPYERFDPSSSRSIDDEIVKVLEWLDSAPFESNWKAMLNRICDAALEKTPDQALIDQLNKTIELQTSAVVHLGKKMEAQDAALKQIRDALRSLRVTDDPSSLDDHIGIIRCRKT